MGSVNTAHQLLSRKYFLNGVKIGKHEPKKMFDTSGHSRMARQLVGQRYVPMAIPYRIIQIVIMPVVWVQASCWRRYRYSSLCFHGDRLVATVRCATAWVATVTSWPDYHRALVKDILRHCIKVAGHFSSDFRDIFFSVCARTTNRTCGRTWLSRNALTVPATFSFRVEVVWLFISCKARAFHTSLSNIEIQLLLYQQSHNCCGWFKDDDGYIIIIIRIYLSTQTGGYTQAIHLTNQIVGSNIHPYTQTPKCITLGHLWSVPTFIHTHEVITNKNETGGGRKGVTETDGILKIFWNSLQCRNVRQKEVKCSKANRRKRCSSGVWVTFFWPLFFFFFWKVYLWGIYLWAVYL